MQLLELSYPLRLCVAMIYYVAFSEHTANKTIGEVKEKLSFFFPAEMIEEAKRVLNREAK